MNKLFFQNRPAFIYHGLRGAQIKAKDGIFILFYSIGLPRGDPKLFSEMSHLEGLTGVIISSEKQFSK